MCIYTVLATLAIHSVTLYSVYCIHSPGSVECGVADDGELPAHGTGAVKGVICKGREQRHGQ